MTVQAAVGQQQIIDSLKKVPFISALPLETRAELEAAVVRKRYRKDEIIIFEQDSSEYMYIVFSGKVRVVQQTVDGRENIITIHKRNDFFGEMTLIDGKTSPATIVAHEDAVIGLISKNDFERYLLSDNKACRQLVAFLCGRLRDAWGMLRVHSFSSAEQRIVAVLARLDKLYGISEQRGNILNIKLTHSQIANHAAVTRETVTRVLGRLMDEGLIQKLDGKALLLTNPFLERARRVI